MNETSDQVASLLSQPSQPLGFKEATLPEPGDGLDKYEAIQQEIRDKLFPIVAGFFPTAKMKGLET